MEFDLKKSLDETLKDEWEKLFKSVGVSSMDELLQKSEKKATSKPTPKETKKKGKASKKVTKPVSSNGKTEMAIIAPHEDKRLKEVHKHVSTWKNQEVVQALKEASKDHFLVTASSGGKVVGVGAFKRKGKNLHMEHFGSSQELKGVGKKIVQHLTSEAHKRNLGVSINPPKGSADFLLKMGFKDEGFTGTPSLDPPKKEEKPKKNPEKANETSLEKPKVPNEGNGETVKVDEEAKKHVKRVNRHVKRHIINKKDEEL